MKKYFLIFLLVVICPIIVAEIGFRMFLSKNLTIYSSLPFKPDSIIGYRYIPNAKGNFVNKALEHKYVINRFGFPDINYSINKPIGEYRIAIVGQSDETGLDTDGPLNFIDLLNTKFRKTKVRFLNFSVDGGKRGIQNIKLIQECKMFKPDLILLKREFPLFDNQMLRQTYRGYVMNYLEGDEDSVKRFVDEKLVEKELRLRLLDYSYTYRLLAKLYKKHYKEHKILTWLGKPFFITDKRYGSYIEKKISWSSKKEKYKPQKLSEEESIQILQDLNKELYSEGIDFVVFDTYSFSDSASIRQIFDRNSIHYLPLSIVKQPKYSMGKDDGHSSQEGHKAIASAFELALRREKLIK